MVSVDGSAGNAVAGLGCGVTVRRQQCGRNSVGSTHGRKAPGRSKTDSVGTVALGRAQLGAQCCFSNYSNFARI
jgi:hypothetical protein